MHARIFPGRGSGERSRTRSSGRASPVAARPSSAGRSASKSSMMPCIVAWGVGPGRTTAAMLTTPRSVSKPGSVSRPGCVSNNTSLTSGLRLRSSRPPGALDVLRRIAERAEHPVVQPGPARLHEEVRADVLPDDLPVGRHLEDPSVAALADERVAVRQPLGTRDVRAEEVEERLILVFPHDCLCAGIDLDHPGV